MNATNQFDYQFHNNFDFLDEDGDNPTSNSHSSDQSPKNEANSIFSPASLPLC